MTYKSSILRRRWRGAFAGDLPAISGATNIRILEQDTHTQGKPNLKRRWEILEGRDQLTSEEKIELEQLRRKVQLAEASKTRT